jgi:uncharacterized protein
MQNKLTAIVIFICLILLIPVYTHASYPRPIDDYINDWAEVIGDADFDIIREKLKNLEQRTGIEAVVVTINSIYDYDVPTASIEEFATGLFNDWGIGHKKENNGVLILVAVDDRMVRIELGKAYGHYYDSKMRDVHDTYMIPYFKAGDYSRGIYEGVNALILQITEKVSWFSYYKWHILLGVLFIVFLLAGINFLRKGKKGWGWVLIAAAGFLLILLIRLFLTANKSSSGFGGGSSFGGGSTGSW